MALTYFWQLYVNFLLAFSMHCNWRTKMRTWVVFFYELWVFLFDAKMSDAKMFRSARAAVWSYVIASYLGSNGIFKIFNSKWSYDKMLIDWVRSGRTGKYLALGQEVWASLRSVRTPWPRTKDFPVRPSHSVNKYILGLAISVFQLIIFGSPLLLHLYILRDKVFSSY